MFDTKEEDNNNEVHKSHHHHHETDNIKLAFLINFAFTVIELIGGIYTNSMAILSDALHDFGDSLTLGLAWGFERLSHKKADEQYTYGYGRFSLLSALVNSLVLSMGSIFIIYKSVERIFNPKSIDPQGMLMMSILGIFANTLAFYKMRSGSTMNEEVISLHLLEDVLGWIGVFIVSIVLIFKDIPVLDTLLSLVIAVYILYQAVKKLINALHLFLQGSPKSISIKDLEAKIIKETSVLSVHHIHLWSLDGNHHMLSLHVKIKDNTTIDEMIKVKKNIRSVVKLKYIEHVTIELEFEKENCESFEH